MAPRPLPPIPKGVALKLPAKQFVPIPITDEQLAAGDTLQVSVDHPRRGGWDVTLHLEAEPDDNSAIAVSPFVLGHIPKMHTFNFRFPKRPFAYSEKETTAYINIVPHP
jgi:hypothetical protein